MQTDPQSLLRFSAVSQNIHEEAEYLKPANVDSQEFHSFLSTSFND